MPIQPTSDQNITAVLEQLAIALEMNNRVDYSGWLTFIGMVGCSLLSLMMIMNYRKKDAFERFASRLEGSLTRINSTLAVLTGDSRVMDERVTNVEGDTKKVEDNVNILFSKHDKLHGRVNKIEGKME